MTAQARRMAAIVEEGRTAAPSTRNPYTARTAAACAWQAGRTQMEGSN